MFMLRGLSGESIFIHTLSDKKPQGQQPQSRDAQPPKDLRGADDEAVKRHLSSIVRFPENK